MEGDSILVHTQSILNQLFVYSVDPSVDSFFQRFHILLDFLLRFFMSFLLKQFSVLEIAQVQRRPSTHTRAILLVFELNCPLALLTFDLYSLPFSLRKTVRRTVFLHFPFTEAEFF